MAADEIAGYAVGAYVAQKLFAKTLDSMGDDLNKLYVAGREKLLQKAAKKVPNPDDGATPNLRVARDVIWNGAVTDDEVCAEYFGGILAASRSVDGKDDSALIYVDCIKALSSKQLQLHFTIYASIEALLLRSGKRIQPGMQDDLSGCTISFAAMELEELGLRPEVDLPVLFRQGLVSGFAADRLKIDSHVFPYVSAVPTTFGVLLYAAAMNFLPHWALFSAAAFPQSCDIPLPRYVDFDTADLAKMCLLGPDPSGAAEAKA